MSSSGSEVFFLCGKLGCLEARASDLLVLVSEYFLIRFISISFGFHVR